MSVLRPTPAADALELVPLDRPPLTGAVESAEFAAARRFILQLARQLHQHGTPAHRLEATLSVLAQQLGVQAEFFSTPTSRG